ncbi:MAG: polyprenyl diphosphate synthase [Planctomycetota bacterium]|nr:polyprenyl diphosphate synthase [Planctomycetota bacterium]
MIHINADIGEIPRHIAVIMDGNGRWAKKRGWVRTRGHRTGADVVRAITTESAALGIERLTLYAFSSENWSRPEREVRFLMGLLTEYLDGELPTLQDNNIRMEAIGRLDRLPEQARALLDRNREATAGNTAMTLSLALSYGGRDEIVDACRALAQRVAAGELDPSEIDAAALDAHLYAPGSPDVDLVVRTAGEQRLSNFLPWEAVYAEYVSVAPLWPEFTVADFHAALGEYQSRDRRFGRVIEP